MIYNQNNKNKVILSDYSYKRDVANRLFLSSLTASEIDVLHELLCHGTKFPLSDLVEAVELNVDTILPILHTLSKSGLFVLQDKTIFMDKELRKYFEFQIQIFNSNFEPSIDYFQGLLTTVPITVLPSWYSIPRTSDNIFSSIIEKYLLTPKLYEKYVSELVYDDSLCNEILDIVLSSPSFELSANSLRKHFLLSKEKFQEYMLLFEFHFLLASRYIENNGIWTEIISPFKEWKEYLIFEKESKSITLCDESKVLKTQIDVQEDFFVNFRSCLCNLQNEYKETMGSVEKSYREIEKTLRDKMFEGWILVDEFIQKNMFAIGDQKPIHLKRFGKKWRYLFPSYSEQEVVFMRRIICDFMGKLGITCYGEYEGKPCFCITPFGRSILA